MEHLSFVRQLFVEYAEWLGVDLGFQNFQEELAGLPGAYALPAGQLLLAFIADEPAGCVAYRNLGNGVCEMKRLYVRPVHRGKGLGRKLAETAIHHAREAGYVSMRLDSLSSLTGATRLYGSLGFVGIPAYRHNPLSDAVFMELVL